MTAGRCFHNLEATCCGSRYLLTACTMSMRSRCDEELGSTRTPRGMKGRRGAHTGLPGGTWGWDHKTHE
jgi:hypothetical protein